MKARSGQLAVVSGPSGVGKTTLIRRLLEDEHFALSTSATTRPPRKDEREGREYFFLDDAEFDRRVAAGDFLEWAWVHGKFRYGTLREQVDRLVAAGRTVILDIDVQGAANLATLDAVTIFIAPPDFETLAARLRGRGSEDEERTARRLETARHELTKAAEYDFVVVNDDLDRALEELRAILLGAPRKERS
ncbi:MAG: guanylate kinase [Planctomycetota bacterium]